MRAFRQAGGAVLVHLNNVSGGILAGDRLALNVHVDAGASAQITTTGATRLYKHRPGAGDSAQHTTISVGSGALLEYLPDAVIPYAGSRHSQRTNIALADGATLFWWEVLAPGRQESGERFAFNRLGIETDVRAAGRSILRESFALEPSQRPLRSIVRMHDYSYLANFCACQEGRSPQFWRLVEDKLNQVATARTRSGHTVWAASTLASDGVVVRGLSITSCSIHATLLEFWSLARRLITGQDAVPPRKTY